MSTLRATIGRIMYRTGDDPKPPTFACRISSYCLMCAQWFYGQRLRSCSRCKAPIHQWVGDSNLPFME